MTDNESSGCFVVNLSSHDAESVRIAEEELKGLHDEYTRHPLRDSEGKLDRRVAQVRGASYAAFINHHTGEGHQEILDRLLAKWNSEGSEVQA